MGYYRIKKGLDLPIRGEPGDTVSPGPAVRKVALMGGDYIGMKPKFEVSVGDKVKLGQLLFTDKKMNRIRFTSPGCGKVEAIHRGEKRAFVSIVIALEDKEEITFPVHQPNQLNKLDRESVVKQLIDSGEWTALRARPFDKVADPDTEPHSIFVNVMDTRPLAPSPQDILQDREDDFVYGLKVISRLTKGKVYVCKVPDMVLPDADIRNLSIESFRGPHPAGLVGTHIHFLDPVNRNKTVWHIGLQNVIAIGHLFTTGHIDVERVVSIAGPGVLDPKLIRTRTGASTEELTENELKSGHMRVISGSVLSGYSAAAETAFLGRYHQQISVLPEFTRLGFFGWLSPGFHLYSVKKIVASRFLPKKLFDFTTAAHGGERAIVPVGSYEKVMPLDILPTYLLRALAVDDIDEAEKLGCLELAEEDLALCTYVCPSKIDHGRNLRRNLTIIEKEG